MVSYSSNDQCSVLVHFKVATDNSDTAAFGMQFFFGVFLSELSQSHTTHNVWLSRLLTPLLIFLGLCFASYPEADQKWQRWSSSMTNLSGWIFPAQSDTPKYYTSIGLNLIVLGIHLSPAMKSLLSNRYFLFLGKHSYAVYLLHGTFLRTVMTWMYLGIETPTDVTQEDGSVEAGPTLEVCGRVRWYALMPIGIALLYACAISWTRWIDPWCARITEKLAGYVFDDTIVDRRGLGEDEKPLLPQ